MVEPLAPPPGFPYFAVYAAHPSVALREFRTPILCAFRKALRGVLQLCLLTGFFTAYNGGSGNPITVFTLDYTGAALPPNDYDSSDGDKIVFTPNDSLSITGAWKEYSISAQNIPDLTGVTKIEVEYKYSADATFGDTNNDRLMIGIINQDSSYAVTNLSWTCIYKNSDAGATLPTTYRTDTKDVNWELKYDATGINPEAPLVTDFTTIKGIRVYTTNLATGTVYIKSIKFIK